MGWLRGERVPYGRAKRRQRCEGVKAVLCAKTWVEQSVQWTTLAKGVQCVSKSC